MINIVDESSKGLKKTISESNDEARLRKLLQKVISDPPSRDLIKELGNKFVLSVSEFFQLDDLEDEDAERVKSFVRKGGVSFNKEYPTILTDYDSIDALVNTAGFRTGPGGDDESEEFMDDLDSAITRISDLYKSEESLEINDWYSVSRGSIKGIPAYGSNNGYGFAIMLVI